MSAWGAGRDAGGRAADRLWRHDDVAPGDAQPEGKAPRREPSGGRWRDGIVHGGDDAAAEAAAGMGRTSDGLLTSTRTLATQRPPARILAPRLLFLTAVAALVAIGLVMVYSASSVAAYYDAKIADPAHYFERQLAILAASVLLAWLVAKVIPYRVWQTRSVGVVLVVGLCILLVITLVVGAGGDEHGATRWISIGGFQFQPSEFAKVVCVLVVSGIQVRLHRHDIQPDLLHYGLVMFATLGPMLVLIFLQPDMGTALIVLLGVLVIQAMSGVPGRFLALEIVVLAALAALALGVESYRATRVSSFADTIAHPLDLAAYSDQVRSSLAAFASGGLFGVGLGNGVQKYAYLSENHTDFIFAVIGEELGAVGCLLVVALYVLLIWAGLRIACETSSPYGRLVASSSTLLLGVQAVLNMLMTLGAIPVMGKTLPFISYGGSSLVASMLLVGAVLAVSYGDAAGDPAARRRDRLRILSGGRSRSGNREPRLVPMSPGAVGGVVRAFGHGEHTGASPQGAWPARARGTGKRGIGTGGRVRG